MKPPLYVVEGHHDAAKLKLIDPHIQTWITRGSHFKDERVNELKILSKDYDIILLLDPDGAGERIRNRISTLFKPVKHIFIPQELAITPQGKVGIEHMDVSTLKNLLNSPKSKSVPRETWTPEDLTTLGLAATFNAQDARKKLANELGLPYANVKTFCKLLSQFNIRKEDVLKRLKHESES